MTENMNTKPEIDFPEGPAPTELVIEDIVVGDGAEATPGATVEVHYLGVESRPARSSTPPGVAARPSAFR